ncbi:MAG: 50S ribosomal protein L4 [Puniceicoccales bacterium]|nr:50S ribosomal protein L4 [Puniceicoccales bacterium]
MELKIFTKDGSDGGLREVQLPHAVGDVALRNVLVAYQNNFRSGDAQAKTRAEVSGSGKKPYRQKGTGMARRGEKRSPICRGGGVTFGPRKRDYDVKLSKKQKRLALGGSLAIRAEEGSLSIVENFSLDFPKTKEFLRILARMGLNGKSVLMVDEHFSDEFALAARNVADVYMVDALTLNALDALNCEHILVSESALRVLLSRVAA